MGSWLAPNVENLNKILSPFQMSFSANSDTSLSNEADGEESQGRGEHVMSRNSSRSISFQGSQASGVDDD